MTSIRCYICSESVLSVTAIVKHLRRNHVLFCGLELRLECCFPPCSLIFKTYSGFRKHLVKHLELDEASTSRRVSSTETDLLASVTDTVDRTCSVDDPPATGDSATTSIRPSDFERSTVSDHNISLIDRDHSWLYEDDSSSEQTNTSLLENFS
jgi:hypothetical protein